MAKNGALVICVGRLCVGRVFTVIRTDYMQNVVVKATELGLYVKYNKHRDD